MQFREGMDGPFSFERTDTGESVSVAYDPSSFPPDPEMMPLLQQLQQGNADPVARLRFRELWRDRVLRILSDGGRQTVTLTPGG